MSWLRGTKKLNKIKRKKKNYLVEKWNKTEKCETLENLEAAVKLIKREKID